jgi:hypothetical protein
VTKVFAANTLIDTPTSFTLTANYVSAGQTLTNSLTLGTFVVGNIKLQIYDLSLTTSGGTSNIVGNLLNQGSTTGLYTTIQLAPSPLIDAIRAARLANSTNNQTGGQSTPADQGFQGQGGGQGQGGQGFQGRGGGQRGATQQFIGDLSPDSPIPISIPVRGITLLQPGAYKVAFKVTYADDLKNFHNMILNGTINVARISQSANTGNQNTTIFDQIPLPIIIGAVIAIVAVSVIVIKRKRSAKKKLKMLTQGDTDIVSIFDDVKKKEDES